jgi:hypothetical protein
VYDRDLVATDAPVSISKSNSSGSAIAGGLAAPDAGSGRTVDTSGAAADGGALIPSDTRPPNTEGGAGSAVPAVADDDAGVAQAPDDSAGSAQPDGPIVVPTFDAGVVDAAPSDAGGSACSSGRAPLEDGRCDYGFLRRITLDGAQVSETLSDFPVLLRISDSHLAANAAGSGDDIYFTADDGLTALDFEIERYAAGELVVWVRIPSLAAGTDTTLFLGYADGASGRAQPTSVWSAYVNVWHMADDPSAGGSAVRDSTERAHGTARGAMRADALSPGVSGDGLAFDGIDDEITFTNSLWGNQASTFSGWVKQAGSLGEYGTCMISVGGQGDADHTARFLLSHADDGKVKAGFYGDDDLTTAVLPQDEWKYLSWTWDGRVSSVYVDAVRVLGPVTHSQVGTLGFEGRIGNTTFRFDYFMYGQLDELRIASTARSAAWVAAEYANQRPASTFVKAVGEPEAAGEH